MSEFNLLNSDKKTQRIEIRISLKDKLKIQQICDDNKIPISKFYNMCTKFLINKQNIDVDDILKRVRLDEERNIKRSTMYMIKDFWRTQREVQFYSFSTTGYYNLDFFKNEQRILKEKFDKLDDDLKGVIQSEVSSICALTTEIQIQEKLYFLTELFKLKKLVEDKRVQR